MTQDELHEILNGHEWRDTEFKEAQRDVPRSAYETVSAFDQGRQYALVDHLRARFEQADQVSEQVGTGAADLVTAQVRHGAPSLSTDQVVLPTANLVTPPLTKLTPRESHILALCEVPRTLADLMKEAGFSNRTYFKRSLVNPLIERGLIGMTKPDKKRAKDQKYVVTEDGVRLLRLHKDRP